VAFYSEHSVCIHSVHRADELLTNTSSTLPTMTPRGGKYTFPLLLHTSCLLWATHRYLWDEEFDLLDFEQLLASFNQMHITRWLPLHGQVGDVDFGESQDWIVVPQMLRTMKRVSFASEVEGVLIETGDIALPVLLPADFALHVNTLVEEAQRDAGFDPKDILTPLNTSLTMSDLDYADATLRLFVWSIPASLMWQQMDRRIDE